MRNIMPWITDMLSRGHEWVKATSLLMLIFAVATVDMYNVSNKCRIYARSSSHDPSVAREEPV